MVKERPTWRIVSLGPPGLLGSSRANIASVSSFSFSTTRSDTGLSFSKAPVEMVLATSSMKFDFRVANSQADS